MGTVPGTKEQPVMHWDCYSWCCSRIGMAGEQARDVNKTGSPVSSCPARPVENWRSTVHSHISLSNAAQWPVSRTAPNASYCSCLNRLVDSLFTPCTPDCRVPSAFFSLLFQTLKKNLWTFHICPVRHSCEFQAVWPPWASGTTICGATKADPKTDPSSGNQHMEGSLKGQKGQQTPSMPCLGTGPSFPWQIPKFCLWQVGLSSQFGLFHRSLIEAHLGKWPFHRAP